MNEKFTVEAIFEAVEEEKPRKRIKKTQTVSDDVIQVSTVPTVKSKITKPLLADTCDDITKLTFPLLATPKIDGIRALRINDDLLSRQFKQIRNMRIRTVLKELLPEGSDGEILVAGTFQDVSSSAMSVSGSADFDKPFMFYWFDYVKDDPKKPYVDRLMDMSMYVKENPDILKHKQAQIIPLIPEMMHSAPKVLEYEKRVLSEGFEGVMVRRPDGPYKMGRSTSREGILLKLKKFNDAEATVVGVQELQHNNNEKVKDETGSSKRSQKKEGKVAGDKLGALVVQNSEGAKFNIGTGFTDKMRVEFWEDKDSLIGKIVKYKYFEMGSKDAPRFPTFLGFRDPDDM